MNRNFYTIDGKQYDVPEVFSDIETYAVASGDYEPTDLRYTERGFWVKPDTDGNIVVVTFNDYAANGYSRSGLSGTSLIANAGEWVLTPVISIIESGTDSTNVNIGIV